MTTAISTTEDEVDEDEDEEAGEDENNSKINTADNHPGIG
jgi:hypothetical protein